MPSSTCRPIRMSVMNNGPRVLAIAALRTVLSEFDAKGLPSPDALSSRARDLEASN